MVEKRRMTRREHLERFRHTGRVVTVTSDQVSDPLSHLHTSTDTKPNLDDLRPPLFETNKTLSGSFFTRHRNYCGNRIIRYYLQRHSNSAQFKHSI